jgi:hypothetical protein
MNRLPALLGCLALGGLVAFWIFEGQFVEPEESALPGSGAAASEAVGAEDLAAEGAAPAEQRSALAVDAAPGEADAPAPAASPLESADFRWSGRVLTPDGAPLAGCAVGLTAAATAVPFMDKQGFLRLVDGDPSARTDVEGRFLVEGRATEFERGLLWVLPPRELAVELREVRPQPEPASNQIASPQPGERDLGDLTLGPAGWLTGRVVDEIGAPIEGALVKLGRETSYYSEAQLGELTGADGNFELGHLPAGKYMASAVLEGRIAAEFGKVTLTYGEGTDVGDILLPRAQALHGRVIDRQGRPVADARVLAVSDDFGSSDQTRTDAEGRFTAYVPEAIDHRPEVSAGGYQTFGAKRSSELYPVGGAEATIVLDPELRITFALIDARSGAAITRFGLSVQEGMGSENTRNLALGYSSSSTPSYREYASGETRRAAIPGKDSVTARAPGYEAFSGDVALDPGAQDRMTIALEPTTAGGWSLSGRLVDAAGPVAATRVTNFGLVVPYAARHLSREEREADLQAAFGWSRDDYGMEREETDGDGRFSFERPAAGQRLLLADLGERCAAAGPLTIRTGESLDLGEVRVGPWARLAGRLQLPPNIEPGALTLRIEPQGSAFKPLGDGSFELDQLYPLDAHLSVDPLPGLLLPPLPLPLSLQHGETTEVEWDLRSAAAVQVSLEVRAFGEPAPWRNLRALTDGEDRSVRLGNTDAAGRLTADIPSQESLRWAVYTANRTWWEHPTQRIHPTGELQVLDLDLPEVHLRLPYDPALDDRDTVQVVIESSEAERPITHYLKAEDRGSGQLWITLRDLAPGTYRLRAMLTVKPEADNRSWMREPREDTATEFELDLPLGSQLELNWADGQGDR